MFKETQTVSIREKSLEEKLTKRLRSMSKKSLVIALIFFYATLGTLNKEAISATQIKPAEKPKDKKSLAEKKSSVPVTQKIEQARAILPYLTKKVLEGKIIETLPSDQQVIDFCYSFYDQGKDHADYLVDKVPPPKSTFTLTTESFRADNETTTSRQLLGELPAPNQTVRLISNTLSSSGAVSIGASQHIQNRFMDIIVFSEANGAREIMPGEKYTAIGHGETEKQAIADALREAVVHQKVSTAGLTESGQSNKQTGVYINCHGFRRLSTNKADGLITGYQIISVKKKDGLYEAVVVVTLGEYKKT